MLVDHLRRVHPVDVVGAEDDDDVRPRVVDQVETLEDRVRAAGVPAGAEALLRGHRGDVVPEHLREPPGRGDVPVEAVALVLGEHRDLPDVGVHQVGQDEVDEPVVAAEGHGRFGPVLSQGGQPLALTAGQDDAENPRTATHGSQRIR
jgi:hypothetical protein